MPIDVACSHCGHAYSVNDDAAGRRFKCKECGDVIDVPGGLLASVAASRPLRDDLDLAAESPPPGSTGFGAVAPPKRRRFAEDDDFAPNPLGKVSLILGCVAWGLALVGFVVLMVMGFSAAQVMEQNGGQPPDQKQAMTLGFVALGACGIGCLGFITSIAGAILAGMALAQDQGTKGHAIGGLVLNGLYLLGGTGVIIVSIIASQRG